MNDLASALNGLAAGHPLSSPTSTDAGEHSPNFPVVGIGASAGGLGAFTRLIGRLSPSTGMAFVLIQHLDPSHESQLAQLLARDAPMPVQEAIHDQLIEPDHIYVIPPNSLMGLSGGRLVLRPRETVRGSHLSIDFFFRSLALACEARAVGVVLTGTGSDGTLGLAAIRAAAGITFAQDPMIAEQAEMPRSAIASGCVDFVLSEQEIANEIGLISRHPYLKAKSASEEVDTFAKEEGTYERILALLTMSGGIDFSHYRMSTIKRRILRRMAMRSCQTLQDYVKILAESQAEGEQLLKDVLINVTNFFRDGEVFQALRDSVFPALCLNRVADSAIRIWVAGCSTGQETYSLAIELIEFLDTQPIRPLIQVFATDISESCLIKARSGVYLESIQAEVSPERLRRHFTKITEGYRVNKSIRDMCVFARHDLVSDTPFSKIDMISCRNVLIYMSPNLQMRVMPTFHYALNTPGFLVLGNSETIGRATDLFKVIDQQQRIYGKNRNAGRIHPHALHKIAERSRGKASEAARQESSSLADIQRAADRYVLGRYAPSGVLIDAELNIIQFRGEVRDILDHGSGEPSLNLLKMSSFALSLALKDAIEEVRRTGCEVRRIGVRFRDRTGLRDIDVRVTPIRTYGDAGGSLLVLFERHVPEAEAEALPVEGPATIAVRDIDSTAQMRQEMAALKRELVASQDYLESLVEENRTVTDELKFANDESHSSNEELRCANEELQTAKEEVESANEELATLNEELGNRNADLTILTNDLTNLLDSIDLPVVMLSGDLCLRRMTVAAERVLHLVSTDLGRPIAIMTSMFDGPDLARLTAAVIATSQAQALEVMDRQGDWFTLHIKPYRTEGGRVSGAVLTMIDINAIKGTQIDLMKIADFSQAVVEAVREPLLVLNPDLKVQSVNHAYCRIFDLPRHEAVGRDLLELNHGLWNLPKLRQRLSSTLDGTSSFDAFEVSRDVDGMGTRNLVLSARCVDSALPSSRRIVMGISDITEQKRMTDELRTTGAELLRSNSELVHFASVASHDLQEPVRMIKRFGELLRQKCGDGLGEPCKEYLDIMISGATRMQELIRSILEYSRVGNLALKSEPIDLNIVLRAVLANLDVAIHGTQATIDIGPMPTVVGDYSQLTQLFQNLVANAIKFHVPTRPSHVTIRAREFTGDWSFSIEDNGIGIRPEDFDRVFKLFQCLNPPGDYPGMGIGLATCKRIVERHHGRLWPEAKSDGMIFHLSLPKDLGHSSVAASE